MKRNLSTAALLALFCIVFGSASVCVAQSVAPATLVRNLYAEGKAHRGPFYQTKSRSLLDKYFTKEFADVIWKDRVKAGKEVPYLDFDPLYDAQDIKIKNLKIGDAKPDKKDAKLSYVFVTFNNMGNATTTVKFELVRSKSGVWKIDDIVYPGDEAMPSVKEHLQKYVGK